jgi:hypothetical protein
LACSNVSQANQIGSAEYRAKYAKPQIALSGERSLKRNGENSGAMNERLADGRQKLISVNSGRARRNSYQPLSVTATVPSTFPFHSQPIALRITLSVLRRTEAIEPQRGD